MACGWCGTKPLFEAILNYCQVRALGKYINEIWINIQICSWGKSHLKMLFSEFCLGHNLSMIFVCIWIIYIIWHGVTPTGQSFVDLNLWEYRKKKNLFSILISVVWNPAKNWCIKMSMAILMVAHHFWLIWDMWLKLFNGCFVGIHDDVIKWKHFLHYRPFVQEINWSPVNSPHKGQWRGALMFPWICAWMRLVILRCHCTHCEVIIMIYSQL